MIRGLALIDTTPSRMPSIHVDEVTHRTGAEVDVAAQFQLPIRSDKHMQRLEALDISQAIGRATSNRQSPHFYHGIYLEIDPVSARAAIVGKLGAMKRILDPLTLEPLTPGCHNFTELGESYAMSKTGASVHLLSSVTAELSEVNVPSTREGQVLSYHLSGVTDIDSRRNLSKRTLKHLDWAFPVLQHDHSLTDSRLGIHTTRQLTSIEKNEESDVFNFSGDKILHPNIKRGNSIYEMAIQKTMKFAAKNKGVLQALQTDGADVCLPHVQMDKSGTTRLAIAQTEHGNTHIIIYGYFLDETLRTNSGFHLVRDPEGSVYLTPGDHELDAPVDSKEYREQLAAAEKTIQEYFKRLNMQADLGVSILNVSLPEIRSQVRELPYRRARKVLRTLLK